jgi:hypothetical protein
LIWEAGGQGVEGVELTFLREFLQYLMLGRQDRSLISAFLPFLVCMWFGHLQDQTTLKATIRNTLVLYGMVGVWGTDLDFNQVVRSENATDKQAV